MARSPTEALLARIAWRACAVAAPAWAFWRIARGMLANGIGYDEQFFMWGGWSILKGLAPYKEFIEFKPPMTFLAHALALALFGYQGQHFRYFFLWLSLASLVAFVASMLSRRADPVLTATLGFVIVHLFTGPYHEAFFSDTESIGTSFYLLGVACAIAETRFRKAAEVLSGVFLTCCVLSKEPFAGCVVATWAGCYFMVYGAFTRATALRYLELTGIGVAVALGALSLYMVPTGAMSAYLATVKSYATMFRDPTRGYCVVLGRFHPQGWLQDLPAQWTYLHGQFVNVATLGFLAPFFGASLVFVPRRSWALFLSALMALLLAFYGVTVSNCYALHYYIMAESGLFFFLAAGIATMSPQLALARPAMRAWARAVFVLVVVLPLWPHVTAAPPFVRNDAPPKEPAPGLFDFIREHTTPADKIFTTGPPSLYVYVDRLSAVRESSIIDELVPALPGNTDAEKLRPLYEELVRERPKVVFLDPEHGPRKYRHLASAIMPFLTDFKYEKVSETLYLRP